MRQGSHYGSNIELWAWAAMLGVRVDVVVAQFSVLGTLAGWAAVPYHSIVPTMQYTILPASLQEAFGRLIVNSSKSFI